MAQPERYFIGPNVREKLTEVFARVGGMPAGSGGQTPVMSLQDIQRPPTQSLRAATFTGSWAIGTTNTVTFKYEPTATQTVTNLTMLAPIAGDCMVGQEGTSWWAISSLNPTTRLCKTSSAFNKGTVATLNVWESGAPPSETQTTGVTIPDVVNKYANIATGKFVSVAIHGNGRYYVIAAECS